MKIFKSPLLLLIVPLLVCGCAGTQQVSRQLEMKSHFLGPKIVSKLKEGGDDQAGLVYTNPGARWPSYDKVMVDPVQIWKDEGTKDVEPEDLARLANDLWSKIREEMGKDHPIVETIGSHVGKSPCPPIAKGGHGGFFSYRLFSEPPDAGEVRIIYCSPNEKGRLWKTSKTTRWISSALTPFALFLWTRCRPSDERAPQKLIRCKL